jgi:hypothetical protein
MSTLLLLFCKNSHAAILSFFITFAEATNVNSLITSSWHFGSGKLKIFNKMTRKRRYSPDERKTVKRKYSLWGSNPRPSACEADVIAARPNEQLMYVAIFLCYIKFVVGSFKCVLCTYIHVYMHHIVLLCRQWCTVCLVPLIKTNILSNYM